MTEITKRLELATALATEAGILAQQMRETAGTGFVAAKGAQDFVTEADHAVERLIRERVAAAFPGDSVLGEEEGGAQDLGQNCWVVDPIDGTSNYMRGMTGWGVSIGFVQGDEIEFGVISLPDLSLLATAQRGKGAFVNGAPMAVSANDSADASMLSLGRSARAPLGRHLDNIRDLFEAGMEYRREGAAVMGLIGVATGWTEGYFEAHINAWDACAGIVIISEAGGRVEHAPVREFLQHGSRILVTNGRIDGLLPAL
jgi:myo-inositol-1(or 4)-monophosphatase